MIDDLLRRLEHRDQFENQYSTLFVDVNSENFDTSKNNKAELATVRNLQEQIQSDQIKINKLEEIIKVMHLNQDRLNDELISVSIQNNVLENKYSQLNQEHNKLIQRWLQKVQNDADKMNETIESQGSK